MRLVLILAVWLAFGALAANAQAPASGGTTTETVDSPVPRKDADLLLDADVHLGSLRFTTVPQKTTLKVTGVNQRGGYTITRTNVPKKPAAGVTYRNVRVQLHLSSQFVDPNGPRPPSDARKP